jgi:hypothetical protein
VGKEIHSFHSFVEVDIVEDIVEEDIVEGTVLTLLSNNGK